MTTANATTYTTKPTEFDNRPYLTVSGWVYPAPFFPTVRVVSTRS